MIYVVSIFVIIYSLAILIIVLETILLEMTESIDDEIDSLKEPYLNDKENGTIIPNKSKKKQI